MDSKEKMKVSSGMEFEVAPEWDFDLDEFMLDKTNGGTTSQCGRCDGTGIADGKPCFSCGGTGWRR